MSSNFSKISSLKKLNVVLIIMYAGSAIMIPVTPNKLPNKKKKAKHEKEEKDDENAD